MMCIYVQVLIVSEELQKQKGDLEQLIDLKERGSMFM